MRNPKGKSVWPGAHHRVDLDRFNKREVSHPKKPYITGESLTKKTFPPERKSGAGKRPPTGNVVSGRKEMAPATMA